MSEKQDYPYQVNFKPGDKPLINVRAETPEALDNALAELGARAGSIAAVNNALASGQNVRLGAEAAQLVTQQLGGQVIQDDGPAPWEQGYQQPQAAPQQPAYQQQAPQYQVPQQGGYQQGPPPPDTKRCQHGEMVYRTGNGAKGPWKAYFCPTPKGSPGQCKAEFVR